MRNSWLIAKRDLNSIFKNSIVAYFILLVFYEVSSVFFYSYLTYTSRADLNGYFQNMYIILIFLIPIITAKSFIEERKNNTFELLLTSPVTPTEIYFGKFISNFLFYLVMIIPSFIYLIFLIVWGKPSFGPIFTAYIGYLFIGAIFIGVGLLFGIIFNNQVVAAIVSVVTLLILWIIDWFFSTIHSLFWKNILKQLSLIEHLQNTFTGLLDFNDILFFVLFLTFLIYATISLIDVKK